jgi:polar amino acid transport system substrate-binding protein
MNRPLVAVLAAASLALTACSSSSDDSADSEPSASAETCTKESLATLEPGTLTIATGEPAYEPWVANDDPESAEGFEAAVAYAAAAQLGYSEDDIQWVRTTFDGAIAPGAKTFDWNLQQFTITEDREKAVDFSTPYYSAPQAVITYAGSPIADAQSVADLAPARLGAAIGSTSLDAAQQVIAPEQDVSVFNDNAAAVTALKNEQIDGIVVDLPTAVYLVDVEVDDGLIVGSLDVSDDYGILLGADSPLTPCTSKAVDALRSDGTLDALVDEWLDVYTSVPTLR